MDPIRRAALYCRVSTDEQAERGYSLRDQEDRLRQWCAREGIDVGPVYVEEGASAKTFNRPQWNRLLAAAEARGAAPFDAILVVKWDRFSRDATGALGMIRRLDGRGIVVQAIEQPIDASVPEQLLMQVLYVAAPEVENRRRSMATKAGMRRAMKEGRWLHSPPKGYARGRDAQDQYLIVPNSDAGHVREAFRLAAETDRSMESIRQEMLGRGFRCSSSQFLLMLRNPAYAGRLVLAAWGTEPEQEVAALHEPLVSADVFAAVHRRRFAKKDVRSVARRRLIPEIPLRGHLLCPKTGARLSGSGSRSRHGYRVWYYHGFGKGAYRVQAATVHEAFADHLADVRIAPAPATLLRAMAEERATASSADRRAREREARERLDAADEKLLAVDLRFLDGEIDAESRDRLTAHLRAARDEARSNLAAFARQGENDAPAFRFAVDVLERLPDVWRAAPVEARDALAGSIWPAGLVFDGARFRTPGNGDLIGLLGGARAENGSARRAEAAGRPVWGG